MKLNTALYGLGTVGGGLVDILRARRDALRRGEGLSLALRHIVVRDPERERSVSVDASLLTTDHDAPKADPDVSIVVEAMGGIEPAGTVVADALRAGRHVVTANKALIAARGEELEALARENGAMLRYEAAVGAAIPILHALPAVLAANRVTRVRGIINGSTNYVLTRMARDGLAREQALEIAGERGFLEADPSADLSGLDAAHKLVILARHAFGRWLDVADVDREGIEAVTAADIDDALRRGERIKLIADAARHGDDGLRLRVAPTALPEDSPLARVDDEVNAVELETDFAGTLVWTGSGAGAHPTGSAVYSDLVEAARACRAGREAASA